MSMWASLPARSSRRGQRQKRLGGAAPGNGTSAALGNDVSRPATSSGTISSGGRPTAPVLERPRTHLGHPRMPWYDTDDEGMDPPTAADASSDTPGTKGGGQRMTHPG